MVRRVSARFFVVAFLVASAVGAAAWAGDDAKCTVAVKRGDSSPVAQACAKGGRAQARKTMREMVNQAKANGQKFTCDGCHKDLDSYELTANARDDFKKLVAAQKK